MLVNNYRLRLGGGLVVIVVGAGFVLSAGFVLRLVLVQERPLV